MSETKTLSLYQIEDNLWALINTEEIAEDEAARAEINALIPAWLEQVVEKRDRVAQFQVHCEEQAATAAKEIARLQARKKKFEAGADRIDEYVRKVIMDVIGKDEKGRYRQLEGNTFTYSLRKCPESVQIEDGNKIPAAFKNVSVSMSVETWEYLVGNLSIEERDRILKLVTMDVAIDKRPLLAALKAKQTVDGAAIAETKYSVKRD